MTTAQTDSDFSICTALKVVDNETVNCVFPFFNGEARFDACIFLAEVNVSVCATDVDEDGRFRLDENGTVRASDVGYCSVG